ncbi:hypothetical protein PS834_00270 [Pseudomonas fluorescens]|nr:hypothetical protein PS834_00270 [Pseudomonas fluorescens]
MDGMQLRDCVAFGMQLSQSGEGAGNIAACGANWEQKT